MKHQRVRAQKVDQTARAVDGYPAIQLHRAEVGQQRDVRRMVANVERRQQLGLLQQGAA